jgi:hypothetical protein
MCEWGTVTVLELTIPAHLSHTGEARQKRVGVDSCIAPIVKALNDAGAHTIASCCGHGHRPGNIILGDGRELIIAKDFETARKIDNVFLDIHGQTQAEREDHLDTLECTKRFSLCLDCRLHNQCKRYGDHRDEDKT